MLIKHGLNCIYQGLEYCIKHNHICTMSLCNSQLFGVYIYLHIIFIGHLPYCGLMVSYNIVGHIYC